MFNDFIIFISKRYNTLKTFFKDMISGKSDTSSKRFAGLIALAVALFLAGVSLVFSITQFVFEGLLYFSAAMLASTLFEKRGFSITSSKEVVTKEKTEKESSEEEK